MGVAGEKPFPGQAAQPGAFAKSYSPVIHICRALYRPAASSNLAIVKLSDTICLSAHRTLGLHRILYQLCGFCFVGSVTAADISGEWEFAAMDLGDTSYARVNLKIDDRKLTGNLNELRLEGTIKDGELTFSARRPNGGELRRLHLAPCTTMRWRATAVWFGDRKVTWSAKRQAIPPAAPKVHDFQPTEFHRVFSDAIAPALHIFPGDTVRTWTVDAGGIDSKGVRRSQGGNPQTGPFYIEGALPGDTLAVKLNRVRLNRDSASSGNRIVLSALTTGYVQRTKYDDKFDSEWVLDREHGIGHLKKPSERLKNYQVKLQPMLGCVAVAPPSHQAFRTGYLGSYGGNLDYNQIREGTTLYSCFRLGALLFVAMATLRRATAS